MAATVVARSKRVRLAGILTACSLGPAAAVVARSKRVRTACKVRAEYGAVKDLPPEQGRGGHGKGPAPPSSTALALPGTQHTKDAHREGTSSAIIPAPLMLPKAPKYSQWDAIVVKALPMLEIVQKQKY